MSEYDDDEYEDDESEEQHYTRFFCEIVYDVAMELGIEMLADGFSDFDCARLERECRRRWNGIGAEADDDGRRGVVLAFPKRPPVS